MGDSTPLKQCSACGQDFPATREFFYAGYARCKPCSRTLRQKRYVPPEGHKRCSKCGAVKLATPEFFHRSQKERDHLTSACKECINASRRKGPLPDSVQEGYKQCPQCKEIKPATFEFFHRRWKNRDVLYPWCKMCVQRYDSEHYKPRILPDEADRTCTRCQQAYPATPQYFYRNKNGVNGLTALCKRCIYRWGIEYRQRTYKERQVYMRHWKQQNQAYIREYSRRYYSDHVEQAKTWWNWYSKVKREAIQQQRKRYYATHRDRLIAQTRERRKNFVYPSETKKYQRDYYRAHREYYIAKAHERRAQIMAIPGTHTAREEREQYSRQHGKCYYCHKKVKWGLHHLDHTVPVSRPHARNSIDYLVIACKQCNLRKSNKMPHEWPEGGRLL